MNFARVIVEKSFGSLKNRWQILKIFNSNINKAQISIVAENFERIGRCFWCSWKDLDEQD
jgi:hypothetical protein